ncbi:MAG: 16S rRNA processing protein RimM, partial [Proteobacteria bacterium]
MKDAHGIRGELFVVLFAGEAAWLPKLKTVCLLPKDGAPSEQMKMFEVKSARVHKNGLIVKTTSIKDRNEAETLKGWTFVIPEEFLVSEKGESIFLTEIDGFKVVTKAQGEVGKIVGFSTNTVQDLLVVKTAKGEFDVPFVEALVERVDYDAKTVYLDLPLGLLGELEGEKDERDGLS